MSVWEFVYADHNSPDGAQCCQSSRIVPSNIEVSLWGKWLAKASCASCGQYVELFEAPVEPYVKPGTLASVDHEPQFAPSAD